MSDRLRNVLVCKSWSCEFHLQLDVGASEIVASWCFRASRLFAGLGVAFALTVRENLLLIRSRVNGRMW